VPAHLLEHVWHLLVRQLLHQTSQLLTLGAHGSSIADDADAGWTGAPRSLVVPRGCRPDFRACCCFACRDHARRGKNARLHRISSGASHGSRNRRASSRSKCSSPISSAASRGIARCSS
jgi:hypothetical protein